MMSLGVTGQIAGGQWMQETIHSNTGNVMPEGWKYQIANDAVINYRIQIEKQIAGIKNILNINATACADAGTLLTKASIGANIMIGYFENPYRANWQRKFSTYIYIHPQINAVGYDATLQGGLFTKSIYTIPASAIERVVADYKYGFVLRYSWLYLEYTRTCLLYTSNCAAVGSYFTKPTTRWSSCASLTIPAFRRAFLACKN